MCHLLPSDSYKGEELWVSFYINVLRGTSPCKREELWGSIYINALRKDIEEVFQNPTVAKQGFVSLVLA
jgi:hypothetical protein